VNFRAKVETVWGEEEGSNHRYTVTGSGGTLNDIWR
jgi:hypothetical protein